MLTSLFGDLGPAKDPDGKKSPEGGDDGQAGFAATAIMETVATEVNDRGQMVDRHLREVVVTGSPAQAIRDHWAIENRSHYVRDGSFREDSSRIRCNPAIFARLRSFASNILRFNGVENVCDTRYRITLGGLDALCSLRFM